MEGIDTTQQTAMLSQKSSRLNSAVAPCRLHFYFEHTSAEFRPSAASNGTFTALLPTLSYESKARTENSVRACSFSAFLRG